MDPARWNPAVSTPPWYVGLLVAAGLIAAEVGVVQLLRDPPPHTEVSEGAAVLEKAVSLVPKSKRQRVTGAAAALRDAKIPLFARLEFVRLGGGVAVAVFFGGIPGTVRAEEVEPEQERRVHSPPSRPPGACNAPGGSRSGS